MCLCQAPGGIQQFLVLLQVFGTYQEADKAFSCCSCSCDLEHERLALHCSYEHVDLLEDA